MMSYAWVVTILLYLDVSLAYNKCASKLIPGTESPVCVCNSTYCDTFPTIEPPGGSQCVSYVSSMSGLRFQKNILSLRKNNSLLRAVIEIDPNTEYQNITGWGGAITDAAAITIKKLNKKGVEKLMKSYFAKDGLEYNIARIPIGSTDFSSRFYTYDEGTEDRELKKFALAEEDTKYKIPLIKLANNYTGNSLKLLAAAWFAPNWIQTKNNSEGGSIKKSMYQVWADYHLKFLQSYKEQGLDFWAVSTGNEPIVGVIFRVFGVPVPSIGWKPKDMCKWIASNLGPTFNNSEFSNVKIVTGDDWRSSLLWQIHDVFSCKNSKNYIQGIAVHWYEDDDVPPIVLDLIHQTYPNKFIIYTEACTMKTHYGIQYGSWMFAEFYAADIIQNLNHWATGWVDWNIALNMSGGPNIFNNEVNAPIFIDANKGEFYKQPMYYALGHFSKFLPKGSVRIRHKSRNNSLLVVTAKRSDGAIVTIILNWQDREVPVTIQVEKEQNVNVNVMPKSIVTVLC